MEEFIDHILIFAAEWLSYIERQCEDRTLVTWVLFFFPFVVFLELPRYALPLVILPLIRLFRPAHARLASMKEFIRSNPSVSIVIAARNEENIIGATIESLLSIEYDNLEIILVDDHSDDGTCDRALPYARRGLIKLYRNRAHTGRFGRPSASNYGFRMAGGDFIISVDADTTFDRDSLFHAVGPFYDPRVGVVAGNIKVGNTGESTWADLQAAEYLMSIDFWKRWTTAIGTTLMASGAFSAFRREVLADCGAWDPELAEDADLSVKARKAGWKIHFAPGAVAMTHVPRTLAGLVKQRIRWEKGFLRTFYRKHGDALRAWRFNISLAGELAAEFLMTVVMNLLFVVYIGVMIAVAPRLLAFVLLVCYLFYTLLTAATLSVSLCFSDRRKEEWFLLQYVALFPLYKLLFLWVRSYGLMAETLRIGYRDPFLPDTAYDNTRRW